LKRLRAWIDFSDVEGAVLRPGQFHKLLASISGIRNLRRMVTASSFRLGILLSLACFVAACQVAPPPERLRSATNILTSPDSSPAEQARAETRYRQAMAAVVPGLLAGEKEQDIKLATKQKPDDFAPGKFGYVQVVRGRAVVTPGLIQSGLGAPAVGVIPAKGPFAPSQGYRVPVTTVAVPGERESDPLSIQFVNPMLTDRAVINGQSFPLAMNLEAPITATRAIGPGSLDGFRNMLRSDQVQSRLIFFQPFDPNKIPVVLVHGLMSTPRMWESVVATLWADPEIRERYQFWFFYYATGKPVPLTALELREALDAAARQYRFKPAIIIGHSMGGILARALVSHMTPAEAETILPGVSTLVPEDQLARRALIFEPRRDVSRVVFIATPHRGSRVAHFRISELGIRLIRLPGNLIDHIGDLELYTAGRRDRIPTSIHGLSPNSRFLAALDLRAPVVPAHSIIANRGSERLEGSSDGVVDYESAHLASAVTEVIVPAGHGGFNHPLALAELRRILNDH
jgi:pimeloyl-ACP methyl ester carboxylesterase